MIQNNTQQWKIKSKISETAMEAPHDIMQTLVPFNEEYPVFNSVLQGGLWVPAEQVSEHVRAPPSSVRGSAL